MKDQDPKELCFDKRVVGMYIHDRTITRADLDKRLGSLPDLEDQALWIDLLEFAPKNWRLAKDPGAAKPEKAK